MFLVGWFNEQYTLKASVLLDQFARWSGAALRSSRYSLLPSHVTELKLVFMMHIEFII